MPNFAGAGLAMQGANAAQQDTMALRTQQLGLDDLERTNATNEDLRRITAAGGTHEDMAKAAEGRGDYARAEQHRRHAKTLEDEGVQNVVKKALVDPTPGDRPDLVEEANRYLPNKGMHRMTLDENGNLAFQGVKSGSLNVGVAAERMGLVKPFEHVLAPGATYVRNNPVTNKTTSFTAPEKKEVKGYELGTINKGGTEYKISFNKDTGEATLLDETGNPTRGEAKVHTDPSGKTLVTIGRDVFEVQPATPGAPGSSGFLGFGAKPEVPGTPARLTPISAPGGNDAPPVQGARKAPDGNWYVPDPQNQGRFLQVIVNGGAPGSAAPKPAAPAPKPAAPKPAPKPATTPVKADEDALPEVATPPSTKAPAERHQSRVAAERSSQDKARALAPKQKAAETFRAIASSPRMTAEDAPLIQEAIDSGLLTPAEKVKAERMLAKLKPQTAGYARGGKVQRYGL